jgi:hypothetical protein
MATAVGAHIQLATPPAMRGRAAALKITVEQLLGISVGPALVAAITEFGLRDPARVGHSIVLMYVGLVPIAIVILALGRGPAREALRETLA